MITKIIKGISCLIIMCLVINGSHIFAKSVENAVTVLSSDTQNISTINKDQPSSTRYEVANGAISKEITDYFDGTRTIITYSYQPDGTVNKSIEVIPSSILPNETVTIQSEPDDIWIYDETIINKLDAITSAYQMVENEYTNGTRSLAEKQAIQSELHTQADFARADYIIMNPNSTYAWVKLGGPSRSYPLNRDLYYNASSPLSGLDVTVIQRTLQLYEYLDMPDNIEYGRYGAATEEAVKNYQLATGMSSNGIVGQQMFNYLFASWNNNKRSLGNLNQINIFRLKHNIVQQASVNQLSTTYGTCSPMGGVCKEIYIPGGGKTGGPGYADIVALGSKYIWEVKPNSSRYNESSGSINSGAAQLERYIRASSLTQGSYFPLTVGTRIAPFRINWSPSEYISVRPGNLMGPKELLQSGMIYYQTHPNIKQPIAIPSPQESTQKQKNPDMETLAISVGAIGAGYVVYRVGKAIIGVALIPATGPVGVAIILAP